MSGIEASIDCALDLCDQLHELKTVVSGAAGMIAATGDNCSTDTVTAAAWMLDQVAEKIGGGCIQVDFIITNLQGTIEKEPSSPLIKV